MKTFKQLLWFIVPTVLFIVLLFVLTFADTTKLPTIIGAQDYLITFINNPLLLRTLFNAITLPFLMTVIFGLILLPLKYTFIFNNKNQLFNAFYFLSTSLFFHFTANIKQFFGLPPSVYVAHMIINSKSELLRGVNIPAILFSLQVGVIMCFIYWCSSKINHKIKQK